MECIDICPKNAIQIDDIEKEYNALIDSSKCIKCNACHSYADYYANNHIYRSD